MQTVLLLSLNICVSYSNVALLLSSEDEEDDGGEEEEDDEWDE